MEQLIVTTREYRIEQSSERSSRHSLLDQVVVAAAALGIIAWILPLLLSMGNSFTPWNVRFGWLLALAAIAVIFRGPVRRFAGEVGRAVRHVLSRPDSPAEWLWRIVVALFVVTTLAAALLYPPTVWDSNAHHLPRVLQFMQNASVEPFPTYYASMNSTYPFAAYVLAQVALFGAGINSTLNLVQWAAYLMVAALAYGIARQLGANRAGARFSAVLALATPTLVLQATTTQYDLIVAAWAMAAVYVVLRWMAQPSGRTLSTSVLLGALVGLALVTKVTSLLVLGPFAVWFTVAAVRDRRWVRGAVVAVLTLAIAVLVATPLFTMNAGLGGNALGTGIAGNAHILVPDRSPGALWMNTVRNLSIAYATPSAGVNAGIAQVTGAIAGALGVHADSPTNKETADMVYTLPTSVFNPDMAAAPITAAIVLVAMALMAGYALQKKNSARRRGARHAFAYAGCTAAGMIAIAALVTWQPYIVRTMSGSLALFTPLAGVAYTQIESRRALRWLASALVLVAIAYGLAAVTLSATSPLVPRSALTGGTESHGWWNTPYADRGWGAAAGFLAPDIAALREIPAAGNAENPPVAVVGGNLAMAVPAYPMIQALRDAGYVVFYEPMYGPVVPPGRYADLWAAKNGRPDLRLTYSDRAAVAISGYRLSYNRTITELGVTMTVLVVDGTAATQ